MNLRTIWTLRGLPLRGPSGRIDRTKDTLALWLAHRLPRRIAYWSYIDTGVRLIEDNEVVPDVRFMDLLQRADRG